MDAMTFLKIQAGHAAVELVQSNSIVGLGTGSTAKFAVERLAEKLKTGELVNINGVATSEQTAILARKLEIPLLDMREIDRIDLTVDGADEIDPGLNLIKGGGGALLREKIVAQASASLVIIADSSKYSKFLGTNWALPVEIIKMALASERQYLRSLGANVSLRMDNGSPFITDEGNYILDADFGLIHDPAYLARQLENRAGIVEHGLFVGLASKVILAGSDGLTILPQ